MFQLETIEIPCGGSVYIDFHTDKNDVLDGMTGTWTFKEQFTDNMISYGNMTKTDDGTRFQLKLQTKGIPAGKYRVDADVVDSLDGFVQAKAIGVILY